VERELSRVRGEIEQLQGRQRVLASLTELSTVTVTCHEVRQYASPRSPGFGTQLGRTLGDSFTLLREFVLGAILCLAALLPWLIAAGIVGVPAWVLVRRYRLTRVRNRLE